MRMPDTDTHIFQMSRDKGGDDSTFYAFIDDCDFMDKDNNPRSNTEESPKTLAKSVSRDDNSTKFMIKVDYQYKPYNPLSIYGNKASYRGMDQTRPASKFIGVNQRAFSAYLNFLRTKNTSWLHNTEREMQ
jgi:hypothetical protein